MRMFSPCNVLQNFNFANTTETRVYDAEHARGNPFEKFFAIFHLPLLNDLRPCDHLEDSNRGHQALHSPFFIVFGRAQFVQDAPRSRRGGRDRVVVEFHLTFEPVKHLVRESMRLVRLSRRGKLVQQVIVRTDLFKDLGERGSFLRRVRNKTRPILEQIHCEEKNGRTQPHRTLAPDMVA
eukprot:Gregarina_sp_Pseudo_9__5286@NODE_60_length_4714_cov_7_156364_g56_i0_p5_GENE_NODE_60_length_4714_cov_7_156364_g56_i0NODE_60_length_4714_cov_7_156364_g56_i0_p5_ORF_typecomplete_len180_score2_74_NODE_60_length_4714_cov_7_156364_g56_i034403979